MTMLESELQRLNTLCSVAKQAISRKAAITALEAVNRTFDRIKKKALQKPTTEANLAIYAEASTCRTETTELIRYKFDN